MGLRPKYQTSYVDTTTPSWLNPELHLIDMATAGIGPVECE
jgi:hypothetical protein